MLDRFIIEFDKGLRTLFAPAASKRPLPGRPLEEAQLSSVEKNLSAALMRVNHSGEICAQALYQGQAWTARNPSAKAALELAAQEETEHLNWCASRLEELGSHVSYLNPLWYGGSLVIGALAGAMGDKWNLGFLAETERQVGQHLTSHLTRLPEADLKSRAIVEQMRTDEAQHAATATKLGGAELPLPIKQGMRFTATLMTGLAYWV